MTAQCRQVTTEPVAPRATSGADRIVRSADARPSVTAERGRALGPALFFWPFDRGGGGFHQSSVCGLGPSRRWEARTDRSRGEGMQAKSPARTRNIRRIAQRLRADDGFALPTVTLLLVAAFAVVTVGAMASIHTQHGTIRDQQTKAALQLAETGVNEAVLYYNRLTPS